MSPSNLVPSPLQTPAQSPSDSVIEFYDSTQVDFDPPQLDVNLPFSAHELGLLEQKFNILNLRIVPRDEFLGRLAVLWNDSTGNRDIQMLAPSLQTQLRRELSNEAITIRKRNYGFSLKSSRFPTFEMWNSVIKFYSMDNFQCIIQIGDMLPQLAPSLPPPQLNSKARPVFRSRRTGPSPRKQVSKSSKSNSDQSVPRGSPRRSQRIAKACRRVK